MMIIFSLTIHTYIHKTLVHIVQVKIDITGIPDSIYQQVIMWAGTILRQLKIYL